MNGQAIDPLELSVLSHAVAMIAEEMGAVLVRKLVTVRTFNDWGDPKPGYFEADLVQHCGGRSEGSFVHSFVLTDIASAGLNAWR